MKKFLIFTLVMALVFGFVSPTLAKGGNGNGGNGGNNGQGNNSNNNGDSNRNQNRNTERHENRVGDGMPDFYVITGEVTAIEGTAEGGSITVLVYGGKDTSIHGTEIVVPTDANTHFVMKDFGPITFDQVVVGDPVSVAIGSEGIALRVTVGAEIGCMPL